MAICITVMQKKAPVGTLDALWEVPYPAGQKPSPEPLESSPRKRQGVGGELLGSKEGKTVFPKASGLCSAELLGIPEISSPKFQPVLCKEAVARRPAKERGQDKELC